MFLEKRFYTVDVHQKFNTKEIFIQNNENWFSKWTLENKF